MHLPFISYFSLYHFSHIFRSFSVWTEAFFWHDLFRALILITKLWLLEKKRVLASKANSNKYDSTSASPQGILYAHLCIWRLGIHPTCVTFSNTFPPVFHRPYLFFINIINMKVFGVFLTLCTIVALSHAYPHNLTSAPDTNYTTTQHAKGICEDRRQYCTMRIGEFCPQCDANGNFQPQQCWASTGYCWCVDINSGAAIPNTSTRPGVMPVYCGA